MKLRCDKCKRIPFFCNCKKEKDVMSEFRKIRETLPTPKEDHCRKKETGKLGLKSETLDLFKTLEENKISISINWFRVEYNGDGKIFNRFRAAYNNPKEYFLVGDYESASEALLAIFEHANLPSPSIKKQDGSKARI